MSKKTNVTIEFTDLNPSDLSKVTELIDTLGYAIVGYSITTSDAKLRPQTYRGAVSEIDTPYAPKQPGEKLKSDVEGTEAVPVDIQATTQNVSLEKPKNKGKSDEMKSNIKKFL